MNKIKLLSNFNTQEIYFIIYLFSINSLTFLIYGIDKFKAKNKKYRISEISLIIFSLLGGGLGGLMAMVIFKHKLSKKIFYIGIPIIIIVTKILELAILNYIR